MTFMSCPDLQHVPVVIKHIIVILFCLGIYFYFFLLLFLNIGVLFVFQTPVIALVGNDACWSQIAREQVPMFGSSIGCDLEVRQNLVHKARQGSI